MSQGTGLITAFLLSFRYARVAYLMLLLGWGSSSSSLKGSSFPEINLQKKPHGKQEVYRHEIRQLQGFFLALDRFPPSILLSFIPFFLPPRRKAKPWPDADIWPQWNPS